MVSIAHRTSIGPEQAPVSDKPQSVLDTVDID